MRLTAASATALILALLAGGGGSAASSGACPAGPRSPTLDSAATVDPPLVAHLAILRRAQRTGDLPVRLQRGLATATPLNQIAVRAIRYLGRAPTGERFYLVPATIRDFLCLPSGRLTAAQRARWQALRRQIELRTHRLGLALVPVGPDQPGRIAYGEGSLYQDVRANRLIAIFNLAGNRSATLAGVVPDGVRAVRLTYAARTTTLRVSPGTNFWAARVPGPVPDSHAHFTWLDSRGSVRGRFLGITEAPY